tara:strand:- start:128 stop:778 length:651 start_codon:yes stop_codon:yes gene_type:complete
MTSYHNEWSKIIMEYKDFFIIETTSKPKRNRITVKEIKRWMKTLEEHRYKRVYQSDARRVAWMVNNPKVEATEMPMSLQKKWKLAEYKRERYLAKKYLEHMEAKKNPAPRKTVTEQLEQLFEIDSKRRKYRETVAKMFKKAGMKVTGAKDYDFGTKSSDIAEFDIKGVCGGHKEVFYVAITPKYDVLWWDYSHKTPIGNLKRPAQIVQKLKKLLEC